MNKRKKQFWGLQKDKRLEMARIWKEEYKSDENIVKAYSKKFGLNLKNSLKELRRMGCKISNQDKEEVKHMIKKREKQKERKKMKKRAPELEDSFDSNETFAFIAGYTEGGLPFGITHEEMEESEKKEK